MAEQKWTWHDRPPTASTEFGTSNGKTDAGDSAPEEFKRFEDLTRKQTKVPKSELDEKRKS